MGAFVLANERVWYVICAQKRNWREHGKCTGALDLQYCTQTTVTVYCSRVSGFEVEDVKSDITLL